MKQQCIVDAQIGRRGSVHWTLNANANVRVFPVSKPPETPTFNPRKTEKAPSHPCLQGSVETTVQRSSIDKLARNSALITQRGSRFTLQVQIRVEATKLLVYNPLVDIADHAFADVGTLSSLHSRRNDTFGKVIEEDKGEK